MVLQKERIRTLFFFLLVMLMLLIIGCGRSATGDKIGNGFYRHLTMTPNGEFIVSDKIPDSQAEKAGYAYHVEMDKEHKDQISKITYVYNKNTIRTGRWKNSIDIWNGEFAIITIKAQDNGYTKYSFSDATGEPTPGFYDAYSIRFKRDDKKRVTTAYLYNKEGENSLKKYGDKIAQLFFQYDEDNRISRVMTADGDGNPVDTQSLSGGNATALQITYDKNKKERISSISWINQGGNLVKGEYWATESYTYDDKGRIIEKAHSGTDGNPIDVKRAKNVYVIPCMSPNSMSRLLSIMKLGELSAGAKTKYFYEGDSRYPSKIAFFGKTDQNYSIEDLDVSEFSIQYDDIGNIVKFKSVSPDGMEKGMDCNISSIVFAYNNEGMISKESYYHGENMTPYTYYPFENSNVSQVEFEYDDKGRPISESYFDANGSPTGSKLFGVKLYTKVTYFFDEKGNRKEKYYADDGTEISSDPLDLIYGTYKFISTNIYPESFRVTFSPKEIVTSDGKNITRKSIYSYKPFIGSTEGFVSVEINADRFKKEYSVDVINGTLRDWEGTLKKVE